MMLAGLPDLDQPVSGLPGVAWRAHLRPSDVVVIPDRLALEADVDGSPRLRLTLMRSATRDGATTGGRLDIGLTIEAAVAEVGAALAAASQSAAVVVGAFEIGLLELDAALGPVSWAPLMSPRLLEPAWLSRARLLLDLPPEAAAIAARIVGEDVMPLRASLHVAYRAIAPRLRLRVDYDPHALAIRLAERLGAEARTSDDAFAAAIDALLADVTVIRVDGDVEAVDAPHRATVLGLRLADRFVTRDPMRPDAISLKPAAALPTGRERIDLSQPAAVLMRGDAARTAMPWDDRWPYMIDVATYAHVMRAGGAVCDRAVLASFRVSGTSWSSSLIGRQREQFRGWRDAVVAEGRVRFGALDRARSEVALAVRTLGRRLHFSLAARREG